MLILRLVSEGKIDLDSRINQFFPKLPDWSKKISVENLLNHTSGLPDYEEVLNKMSFPRRNEPTNDMVVKILTRKKKLGFEPGFVQQYSESGYVLLTILAERSTGKKYNDLLKEIIINPLKMTDTFLCDRYSIGSVNMAVGYKPRITKYQEFDYNPLNFIVGNEGIYSTAPDLAKWGASWFSNNILPKCLVNKAFAPAKLANGQLTDRGYSFSIGTFRGEKIIYHGGSWVGFRLMMVLIPKRKLSGFLLSNTIEYNNESKRILPIIDLLSKYL